MAPFAARVHAALTELGCDAESGRFAVALSGGIDSTLLLDVMVELAPAGLRALHVDHGLHVDSGAWERHCAAQAAARGVAYASRRLALAPAVGRNLEARARAARYAAFSEWLTPGEVLLTAHHADDQFETLLLRLLRGAGVRGLRGILPEAPLAQGRLLRPLLGFTRSDIEAEAGRRALAWLEDPSNRDPRLDRNRLRLQVLPPLYARWPEAALQVGRSAARMREAETLLEALAEADAPVPPAGSEPLPLAPLLALTAARQRNLLRHLVRSRGLTLPNAAQLEELLKRVHAARADARIRIAWPGAEARVYRNRIYLMPNLPAFEPPAGLLLRPGQPWQGPIGRLELVPRVDEAGLPDAWVQDGLEVRFRRGGERLRGTREKPSESLKHWFQRLGILPWMRDRIPLLYHGEDLVAVADLWQRTDGIEAAERWQVVWSDHLPVR